MSAEASRPYGGPLHFSKMHGAGNDFVIIDLRGGRAAPSPALCQALADRRFGVGCDQILTIEDPTDADVVAAYGIWNSDGSRALQCGNGARCVAAWLVRDGVATGDRFHVDSPAGRHAVERIDATRYRIGMGVPDFEPARIPMAAGTVQADRYDAGDLPAFGAVSMGNPHAVIEVEDVDAAPVADVGRALQGDRVFPDSVNVGFVQRVSRDRVRLRVFERGVGETLACGSGACAAAVVMMRRGHVDRTVTVSLPGGDLQIEWPADDVEVAMTGPTAFVFEGEWFDA